MKEAFTYGRRLGDVSQPKQGMVTRDNERFIRTWWEISYSNIEYNAFSHQDSSKSNIKWYPITKGGAFRKWYGNFDSVVNFLHDGKELIGYSGSHIKNREFYFRESITWSAISSSNLSMRYAPKGFLPEHAGNCLYGTSEQLSYLQAFCNSNVGLFFLKLLSPTLNYNVGDIANMPVISTNNGLVDMIKTIVKASRGVSKLDWDSFETSWDFKKHPLI